MHLGKDLDSYAIIKACLKLVGIWPRDKSRLVILQRVVVLMLIGPYLYMQLLLIFTAQFSITLFIRVLSSCCSFSIIVVGYIFYIFKAPLVLNLDVQLHKDRKMFRTEAENTILQDNASSNQTFLIICSLYAILGFLGFILMQFLPSILDVIFPMNEPRQHGLLLPAEYIFVSQNKYFYTKVLHELVVVAVAAVVCYSIAAQMFLFISHSIGMLKVARYRMQYFIENIVSRVPKPNQERAISKVIMRAVIVHRAALELVRQHSVVFTTFTFKEQAEIYIAYFFCLHFLPLIGYNVFNKRVGVRRRFSKALISTYNEIICCAYVVVMIAISFNLYGLLDALMVLKDTGFTIIYLGFFIGYFIFVLLTTQLAQEFNDHNTELFKVIYSTSWYSLPVSSQKHILFLLEHGSRDYYMKVGFIFEGKLENVALLMNVSLSYVAVMYSCFNE